MARRNFFAVTLFGAGLVAACAGGPRAALVPEGLAFDCEPGGAATIAFNGGGYLPDSSLWGTSDKGERIQVPRSTARLTYGGRTHDLIAQIAPSGLSYRSAAPGDDGRYLVWTTGGDDAPTGAEDAVLALRSDPQAGPPVEQEIARCRRGGRAHDPADPVAGRPGGGPHRP